VQVNVLVTPDGRCCLADFGLAAIVAQSHTLSTASTTHSLRGSTRWMAPEMLTYETPPEKPSMVTDIFAFGCTVLEVGFLLTLVIQTIY
jgi:serine/threonine protein kinase